MACVVLGVVAAAGVVLSISHGEAPATAADKAQVLGTYWAVGAGVLALLAWFGAPKTHSDEHVTATSDQVESAANLLAQRALNRWAEQASKRGIVTPAPVRVLWHWATANLGSTREELHRATAMAVDPALWRDPSAEVLASGVVTRLHDEEYARLQHGRLVLTGGPGAGKTGAMLLLLLAALGQRVPCDQRLPKPRERDRARYWLGWLAHRMNTRHAGPCRRHLKN